MRVHPERAAEAQGEVVVGAAARRNWGSGNPRHAVLPPRRRQPVPMDQARFADAVFDPNAKRLADFGREAKGPVWLADGVNRRRLAVHLDVAPLKAQDRRRPLRRCLSSFARGRGSQAPPSLKRRPQELRVGTAWEASSIRVRAGRARRWTLIKSLFRVERVATGDCRQMTNGHDHAWRRFVRPDGCAAAAWPNGRPRRSVGRR